jgi:hypothetical protein
MRIPLLAQFLVSYRDALKEVHQFTEDGVMHEDFDGGIGDIADIYEDYYLMPCDEPTPSAHEFWQDLFIQHEIEEERSLDQMFLDHIEQSLTTMKSGFGCLKQTCLMADVEPYNPFVISRPMIMRWT